MQDLYHIFLKHPFICTDSRKARKNALFFALKGNNYNGNAFAEEALKAGCAYAVIDEPPRQTDSRYILVENALKTLQKLAQYHRNQINIPVIGITGTNGKTTTKELIAAILKTQFKIVATEGNFNNHIGVPLSILRITKSTQIAVIEMGANHQGEIAALCRIAWPDHGLITNIGRAHLEGFDNLDGVIRAKKELFDHLSGQGGLAFVHSDNSLLMDISSSVGKRLFYGTKRKSDCCGRMLQSIPFIQLKWQYQGAAWHEAHTSIAGAYNFENILASICIGQYFGIPAEKIKCAVEEFIPSGNRSQIIEHKGCTIIMDAYNANPMSMKAAISNLAEQRHPHKIAILGDMYELGSYSMKEHLELICLLKEHGIRNVFLSGKNFEAANHDKTFLCFENTMQLIDYLKKHPLKLDADTLLLLKGSRAMGMERVMEAL